jgi:uncharacterized protein with GYD domain
MQFMSVFRWEPGRTEEIMQQRAKESIPEGMRIINEWTGLGGNAVFRWVEVDDPAAMLAASLAWCDLGHIEMYPVMETKEVMKQRE